MNMHCYPNARSRPLWQYIKPSDVFRCPDDRGQKILPAEATAIRISSLPATRWSAWATTQRGTPWCCPAGIPGRKNSAHPASHAGQGERRAGCPIRRSILMHEPPARIYGCIESGPRWYQWHYAAAGPAEFVGPRSARRGSSPHPLVDGHTRRPQFHPCADDRPVPPCEETADWMWCRGADR